MHADSCYGVPVDNVEALGREAVRHLEILVAAGIR
jgi:hypothetical protein